MAEKKNEKRLPRRRTYSLRLRDPERRLVETAAMSQGQPLSEYIRNAAMNAARHDLSRT